MKKKNIIIIALIVVCFSFNVYKVHAALPPCNIGKSGTAKGYGVVQDWTQKAPIPSSFNENGASIGSGYITDPQDWVAPSFAPAWYTYVTSFVYFNTDANSKITGYRMTFYEDDGTDNGKAVCQLASGDFIGTLTSNTHNVAFRFLFSNGHVYYIYAELWCSKDGGAAKLCAKDSHIAVNKSRKGQSEVKNTFPTTSVVTKPRNFKMKKGYYYVCNVRTKKGTGQKCIKATETKDVYESDYIGNNLCSFTKGYKKEKNCKKTIGIKDITTADTTTNTVSGTEEVTAGGYDINNAPSSQAGLKKGSAKTANYDPSNAGKQCDTLKDLVGKYWKYVMFLVPVALIILITVDFVKGIVASDAETLKKSANAALKRTIAAVVLLILPVILSLILGWFGIDLCII